MLLVETAQPRAAPPNIDQLLEELATPDTQPDTRLATADLDRTPLVVVWEMTRAGGLGARRAHAAAAPSPDRDPRELTTLEAVRTINRVRAFAGERGPVPLLVLTGGDPLMRADLVPLVEYAAGIGIRVVLAASATPRLTHGELADLRAAGIARLALRLEGASAGSHDRALGATGSWRRTLDAFGVATTLGLATQIDSLITRRALRELERLIALVEVTGPAVWTAGFVVPATGAEQPALTSPDESEDVFHRLVDVAEQAPFEVDTQDAPHFRRVQLQRRARGALPRAGEDAATRRINDGRGLLFIDHRGEIQPSARLPLTAGNVRTHDLIAVYRESELFRTLRDRSKLRGKCRACEFRRVCGGSRARAYAVTGDHLEGDPSCAYVPPRYEGAQGPG